MKLTQKQVGIKYGFKSGLEETIAKQIAGQGIKVEYESMKIRWLKPVSKHTYKPDFPLPNGIIVESKGRFMAKDREKHILIQQQHPDLDIRFVFSNPKNKLYKGSKTTYAQWCEKNGFLYAKGTIPLDWFKEK